MMASRGSERLSEWPWVTQQAVGVLGFSGETEPIRHKSLSRKKFIISNWLTRSCVLSRSVVSYSLRPHGLQHTRLLCPWDSPGTNTGVGCHVLLQGIFLTQGSNPCLLHLVHWQAGSLPLAPPAKLTWSWRLRNQSWRPRNPQSAILKACKPGASRAEKIDAPTQKLSGREGIHPTPSVECLGVTHTGEVHLHHSPSIQMLAPSRDALTGMPRSNI